MSWSEKRSDDTKLAEAKNVKERPCYFCNEMFEMGQLQSHLKLCGSILEQCPLRCGAWIQRKHKDTHVQQCPHMEKSRRASQPSHAAAPEPTPPANSHTWAPRDLALDDCITYLEKELATIKLVLHEEGMRRDVHSTELETLRSRLSLVEERAQHFLSTLGSMRAALDDQAERSDNWGAQFRHDLANVQLALQELQSQQLSSALRLESTVSSLLHEQRERELLEQALSHHDTRIRALEKLEDTIAYIKQTVAEECEKNAESRAILETEVVEVRRCSEQLEQLAALRVQLQSTPERPSFDRLGVLEVATADARAEIAELSSRMELVSRDLRALTKSYHKLRAELADFQARVSFDSPDLGTDNGHMIWRIEQFQARMKEAKESDAVLTSPMFRSSRYGYTLKAECHLNGIGRWKGRHVTCTVRLAAGPYDPLLQWPCDLHLNIVLRDQPQNRSQAMDIVKSLHLRRHSSRRRDSEDERSRSTEALDQSVLQVKKQFIFIPHTSLDKFDYVRNDVMFLEFIVDQ